MKWHIGNVEILQIVEMEGGKLIQEFIPNATAENIKKIDWLYPNFSDENGNLTALVQSFLIKSEGKNILVDTCNGNNKNRPTSPDWGNLHTDFLAKLNATGVSGKEIDIVVSTHLHFDHVGWNTILQNGKFVPTFLNATYLFVEKEYTYWQSKPENEVDDDKFAFDDSVTPIVNAHLSQVIKPDYKIDSSVRLLPTPGHTPGHASVMIESQGKKAIISGDVIHHPCQLAHPDWTMGADTLPEKARKTRLKMLEELAGSDVLFIGSHFANPVAGYIKRSGESFILATSNAS